jgi:hypothetical protein
LHVLIIGVVGICNICVLFLFFCILSKCKVPHDHVFVEEMVQEEPEESEEELKVAVQNLEPLSLADIVSGIRDGHLRAVLELVFKGRHQLPGVEGCSLRDNGMGGIDYWGGAAHTSHVIFKFIPTAEHLVPQLLDMVYEIFRSFANECCYCV